MERVLNNEESCSGCKYFSGNANFAGKIVYLCCLTNHILDGHPCEFFNADLSDEKICFNCKYFLGGGDWGLACSKHYHYLPEALSKACDNFCKKE